MTGQVWVMCLALQLGLGQVLEIQGLRKGNVTVLQEVRVLLEESVETVTIP